MKTSTVLVIAAIILAAVATLAIKSCADKKRPAPMAPTMKPVNDSVQSLHNRTQIEIDSLKKAFNNVSAQRDSLHYMVMKQSDQLNVSSIKITAISKEYSLYRKYKDTAKALEACDSLSDKVVELTVDVGRRERYNRLLQNTYDSLLQNKTFSNEKLEYENSVLKQSFDTLYKHSNQLSNVNVNLEKKANKRFAVGPYGGATLRDGKVVPSAGLALTYALFKF